MVHHGDTNKRTIAEIVTNLVNFDSRIYFVVFKLEYPRSFSESLGKFSMSFGKNGLAFCSCLSLISALYFKHNNFSS